MLQKTDKNGIYKDPNSGAIVNKDINKLNAYKKQKAILQDSKKASENIDILKRELLEMKNEVSEMKILLKEIKMLMEMEEK
jgi:hypothetical protein